MNVNQSIQYFLLVCAAASVQNHLACRVGGGGPKKSIALFRNRCDAECVDDMFTIKKNAKGRDKKQRRKGKNMGNQGKATENQY